jgi:hypothetical protein
MISSARAPNVTLSRRYLEGLLLLAERNKTLTAPPNLKKSRRFIAFPASLPANGPSAPMLTLSSTPILLPSPYPPRFSSLKRTPLKATRATTNASAFLGLASITLATDNYSSRLPQSSDT